MWSGGMRHPAYVAKLWMSDWVHAEQCVVQVLYCMVVLMQALNNLQSTFAGFGYVNGENVFKVRLGIFFCYHNI